MATNKNITMKQFNGTDYDTLYPKTKVEQVEGAYTQQQILANATKAMFGLDATAVPDDVLVWLGNYNQHWWKRFDPVVHDYYSYKSSTLGASRVSTIKPTVSSPVSISASYATNEYGEMILLEPITVWDGTTTPGYNYARGKYVKLQNGIVWKADESSDIISYTSGSDTLYQLKVYEGAIKYTPTITAQTDYQFNGSYVHSSDRNAYPDSGVGDAYHYEPVLGSSSTRYLVSTNTGNSSLQNTIYYSDSIAIDTSGNVSLENEQSVSISYSSTTAANALKGKYIRGVMNVSYEVDSSTVYYIPSDASDATSRWDTSYTPAIALMISMQKVTTQKVVDTNAYEYQYLGIPFENAVTAPIFEYGSYIGTGAGGSSAPNSLTFDFTPRLVIICGDTEYSSGFADYSCKIIAVRGITSTDSIGEDGTSTYVAIEWTDKGLSWYSRSSSSSASILAKYQLNTSGKTYYYVAIG